MSEYQSLYIVQKFFEKYRCTFPKTLSYKVYGQMKVESVSEDNSLLVSNSQKIFIRTFAFCSQHNYNKADKIIPDRYFALVKKRR